MRRITLSLSLALGCLMTTQSFGFDLLDRMLGSRGVGCDTACCETPACCPVEPACGCETPVCCPAEPACGCEPTCGIAAGPACGCDNSCDSGCGHLKRGGLLSRLFSAHKSSSCCDLGCDSGCGCGTPAAVSYSSPAPSLHSVPEAPAPIVDPSASHQSKRRVVQASARYVR